MEYQFKTKGVCSRSLSFSLGEDKTVHNIRFLDGCEGNLKAIGTLCEGRTAAEVIELLRGTNCGRKKTSCADQLALALAEALQQQ